MPKAQCLPSSEIPKSSVPQALNRPYRTFSKVPAKAGSPPSTECFRVPPTHALKETRPQTRAALKKSSASSDIGRSLRAVTDLRALGERQIVVDCDVIQADGGTRTASITGGFVALALTMKGLKEQNLLLNNPLTDYVAAVSCGILNSESRLDLCYEEDSAAEVDMNFVVTGRGKFVEIQGTAETTPFSENDLVEMTRLAHLGINELFKFQENVVGEFFKRPGK
jgi:ribonuclease PH